MSAPTQPTIGELAEQLKRTKDSREALRLSELLRVATHRRAEEMRRTTERVRRTLIAEQGVEVESYRVGDKRITNVIPTQSTFVAPGEHGPTMRTGIRDADGESPEQAHAY